MPLSAELILRNARPEMPGNGPGYVPGNGPGDALAVAGGRIAGVGRYADLAALAGPATEVIDCGGRAIVPGLDDAHCHPLAAARAAAGVDCRPTATPDVAAIVNALRAAAATTPGDSWVRGYGYDDSPAGLGRHLRRADLDSVSRRRPVRVEHRSGHACVLNTAGLQAAGIGRDTPEPPGGIIVRDAAGEPTGLLLEMSGWLRARPGTASKSAADDFRALLRRFGQRLLAYGITAVTDAGPENGAARWPAWADAISAGAFPLRVTMMAGAGRLAEMRAAGLAYGDAACGGMLRLGHAKIMLTASAGVLHPHPAALAELVGAAHRAGYPVAIHAVERDAIVAAALALLDAPPLAGAAGPVAGLRARDRRARDRIEHCAECPPDVAELVRQSGAQAVLNPGFLHYDGERYRATAPPELLPHLYPAGALAALGIPLAFGSDAPVIEPNPWAALAAAVTRRPAGGASLGGLAMPSVAAALRIHAGGRRIAAGQPADLAVVEPNPLAVAPADLPATRAAAVIINGRIVRRDGI